MELKDDKIVPFGGDRDELERWRIFIDRQLEPETDDRPAADLPPSVVRLGRYVASLPVQNLDRPEEEWMPAGHGSLGDDPELYAEHLQMQDGLFCDAINQAVKQWSRTQVRPKLTGELEVYFCFRLGLASRTLQELLEGEYLNPEPVAEPPDPGDSPRFLRWLLIDVWEARGNSFLEEVATKIKRDTGPDDAD